MRPTRPTLFYPGTGNLAVLELPYHDADFHRKISSLVGHVARLAKGMYHVDLQVHDVVVGWAMEDYGLCSDLVPPNVVARHEQQRISKRAVAGKNGSWRQALCVTADAPYEVVHAAYRALSKIRHPEAGGTVEEMAALNKAWENARVFYDK